MQAALFDAKVAVIVGQQHGRRSLLACAMLALLLTLIAVGVRVHAAGSDNYVKAIEEEGNRLEVLGRAKKEQAELMRSSSSPGKETQKIRAGQRNAPQEEFERILSNELPGSYALYTLLSASEKTKVYVEYAAAKSEGKVRLLPVVSKIVSLYSNRQWSGNSQNSRSLQ